MHEQFFKRLWHRDMGRHREQTLDTVRGGRVGGIERVLKHTRSVQFSSVAQACPTLCDPMDCSTPGLPLHHQLLEYSNSCPLSQ